MLEMNPFQQKIFKQRYSLNGKESWSDTCSRIAKALAGVEVENQEHWEVAFRDVMVDGLFVPAGRTLRNAGRTKPTLLNCFAIGIDDDINSIGQMLKEVYIISCNQGGVGLNFSNIRPRGAMLRGEDGVAPGSISNMEMVDIIGDKIKSGGSRRAALLAGLNIKHPDILEFLHTKLDLHKLNNFNISVMITDEFMDAVENDDNWVFEFQGQPWYAYKVIMKNGEEISHLIAARDDAHAEKVALNFCRATHRDKFEVIRRYELKARDLLSCIVKNAWECGEPGIEHIDNMNKFNNTSYYEELIGTNPCGEVPLSDGGSCCLGSINLAGMWDEDSKSLDAEKFGHAIRMGIRMLDDVLTLNDYPLPRIKEISERSRRIGLGIMGLAYLLIKADVEYGSDECVEFVGNVFKQFRDESYRASIELAKEKGTFPAFHHKKYTDQPFIQELPADIRAELDAHGIRNACVNSLAPTGTISLVAGTSSGIEPIYAPLHKRTFNKDGIEHEDIVVDKLFYQYLQEGRDVSRFVGATEVTPERHIRVQVAIQKYIDQSMSKTVNLPKDFPVQSLYDEVVSYIGSCKGFTVYRSGSRGKEPLKAIPVKGLSRDEIVSLIEEAKLEIESDLKVCKSGVCAIQ